MEDKFDKHKELASLGGRVIDFDVDNPNQRTQHYEWMIPVFYKQAEKFDAQVNVMYL